MGELVAAWELRALRTLCFVACVLTLLLGCKSSQARALDQEIARFSLAIDAVRDAPNNGKAQPLRALRELTCQHPLACELQALCAQGYQLHQRSLDNAARIRGELAADPQVVPEAARAVLQLSESDLDRALSLIQRCIEREGELLRR